MPENVSFNEIPVDIRTPGQYIEFDNSRAVQGLPNMDRKILVLTQRLSTGAVAAATPKRVLNQDDGENYCGRGSIGHLMLRALKDANHISDVWMVALDDDAAANAAAGSITVTGTATESGTISLYIAGQRVRVSVTATHDADAVATAIAAAINAASDLPVTAAVDGVDTTKVNITARNKGECGNDIDLRANYYFGERTPAGLALTFVAMTGGSANPDVADALAAIGDDQYYSIITAWTDAANIAALEAEMDDRWGPMTQRTGHVFGCVSGTHGTLSTYGSARNSVQNSILGVYDSPTPPWIWASVWGAVVEYHGAIDPARPFQTLVLPGVLAPSEESRFTREERDLLLHDGISTFLTGPDGAVRIERVITTYQVNAYGIEDISYLDLNTKWTIDYIRYAVRARIAMRFPRHKLADDGTNFAPGQAVATPSIIRGELLTLFRELEEVALVENFEQYKADLLVVRSNSDPNRVNAVIPPDTVNQFRVFAGAVQYRL